MDSVIMKTKDKEKYRCYLPNLKKSDNVRYFF